MLGWSNPLPIGQSGLTLTYLVGRVAEVGGKRFSRLPAKRGVIAHLTTTLQTSHTLSLIVSLHHTIIKLPIPHTVYRQILYFPTRLPYLTIKRPRCHSGIHRWQTISGDKGSDNTTKTPPAVEQFLDNSKRTPLVGVLFCFKKEALSVFPF